MQIDQGDPRTRVRVHIRNSPPKVLTYAYPIQGIAKNYQAMNEPAAHF